MLTDPNGNSAVDLVAKARAAKLGVPYLGRPTLDLDLSRAKSDPLEQSIANSKAPIEKEENEPNPRPDSVQPLAPLESTARPPDNIPTTSTNPLQNRQNEPTANPPSEAPAPRPKPPSAAKIASNKANGQRSTGPKTAEGKARASQNSLKHGLFSQASPLTPQFSLPGEAELYAQTLANLTQSLAPHDPLELQLVDRLAHLTVQMDRLTRFESSLLARAYDQALDWTAKFPTDFPDPASTQHASAFVAHAFTAVSREQALLSHHQSRLSRDFARTLTQLRLTQKLRIQTQSTEFPTRIRSLASDGQLAAENLAKQTQPPDGTSMPIRTYERTGPLVGDSQERAPLCALNQTPHVSNDVGIKDAAPPPISDQTNPTPPNPSATLPLRDTVKECPPPLKP